MKLFTKITPTEVREGSFTDDKGEVITYYKIQFIDTLTKKVGEKYMDFNDVSLISCSKEISEQLEVDVESEVEVSVRVKTPRKGESGFPTLNFKIEAVL